MSSVVCLATASLRTLAIIRARSARVVKNLSGLDLPAIAPYLLGTTPSARMLASVMGGPWSCLAFIQ